MLKKFINDSSRMVEEMIEGLVDAFPHFYEPLADVNAVLYTNRRKDRVSLVIGGGTGHEPMFSGFVGQGLADAAVCGNLYNAPDPDSIYKAVKAVESGKGVILLYGTYPGDILNFNIAEERLAAEGITVRHIRVHDDVASAPANRKDERRGIAGDVFAIRVIGAACDAGLDIEDIVKLGNRLNNHLWSIGVSFSDKQMSNPINEANLYEVGEPVIEYGIGLHGERGILRTQLEPVDQLVNQMYSHCIDEAGLKREDEVCVLVNGFGAISLMELGIVFKRVKELLKGDGFKVFDADINTYCASYEPHGFSITLLRMDDSIRRFYEMACYSPFYSHRVEKRTPDAQQKEKKKSLPRLVIDMPTDYRPAEKPLPDAKELDVLTTRDCMIHVAKRLIEREGYLSGLDQLCGDGDHGICIASGMRKALVRLKAISPDNIPADVFQAMGQTMLIAVGGASGAFFGSMFIAAADAVKGRKTISVEDFADMWKEALLTAKKKGGAQPGDKTLVDALDPAVTYLKECGDIPFSKAVDGAQKAARIGAEDTKNMRAKFGRGKFLATRALGCQDPGATTIWLIFKSMADYLGAEEEAVRTHASAGI